ncbi:MAG: phosphate ABC transporter permease PstA [Armatimonadetes bacterium]|nr:phosphate ABC transporter permease PstA [Anaerolineae bacterium]
MILILVGHVLNNTFGLVIFKNAVEPAALADRPLNELTSDELVAIILERNARNMAVYIRDNLSVVDSAVFTTTPLNVAIAGSTIPEGLCDKTNGDLTPEERAAILVANLSQGQLHDLVLDNIVKPTVVESWQLLPSLFSRAAIEAEAAAGYPDDTLEFRSWLSLDFITSSVSSSATTAGLLTALLGTFWIIAITTIVALILGVGAAIYLEEYSEDSPIEQIIEINIRNLAAIPSVIYGMLGLAVFVIGFLRPVVSGSVFGSENDNGRTVLAAGFTLALLVLPNLIVISQEALRAVPNTIREASYGIGATKWQTISRQILPAAAPGILTGVILSISRALGETAPLLVVGASTFIGINPNGPFSKFTVVPIQIYQWTSRPEVEFRNVAAAAIIALLAVMISLNLIAIILRNRFSQRQ